MLCSPGRSFLCPSSSQRVPVLLSSSAAPLGQTENAVVLEKLLMILLRGFFTSAGQKPARTLEIKVGTFQVAARSSRYRRIEDSKTFLGTFLVFRSDWHIYTLSTRTLNPQLQWDMSIACSCTLRLCNFLLLMQLSPVFLFQSNHVRCLCRGRRAALKYPLTLCSQSL